jgi:hypothetical protein
MTKTKPDVAGIIFEIVDGGWWVTSRSPALMYGMQVCFRHNFIKIYPQDLKLVPKDTPAILYNLR